MRLNRRQLMSAGSVLAVSGITAAALSSCGSNGGGGSSDGGGDSGQLVVYTNSNAEGRDQWLIEKAREQGIEVNLVAQGGGDTTNRLIAEKNNPIADVVFGLNHLYYSMLIAEEVVVPSEPSWAGDFDEKLGDPSGKGYFWPLVQQAIVLAYDTAQISDSEAPSDWIELGSDPTYNGRYQTETGLGGATTSLVVSGILTRYQDDSGDLGVSEEGWKVIQNLWANGSPAVEGKDLFARFADQEVALGQMFSSGIPGFEETHGVTTGAVKPSVGVPFAVEQVAMINGTKREDTAKKFIDWLGSADVQAEWSSEFDSMPVVQGAIDKADPSIVERHEGMQQQEIDWEFVQPNLGSWIEKIELEYLP